MPERWWQRSLQSGLIATIVGGMLLLGAGVLASMLFGGSDDSEQRDPGRPPDDPDTELSDPSTTDRPPSTTTTLLAQNIAIATGTSTEFFGGEVEVSVRDIFSSGADLVLSVGSESCTQSSLGSTYSTFLGDVLRLAVGDYLYSARLSDLDDASAEVTVDVRKEQRPSDVSEDGCVVDLT